MAKLGYCWRVKKEVPLLDEAEWEILSPHLSKALQEIKLHREIHGSTIEQARAAGFGQSAIECYFQLTGYKETNPDNLWHYRASKYGQPCEHCGKLLRTPLASHCVECGTELPNLSFDSDADESSRPST